MPRLASVVNERDDCGAIGRPAYIRSPSEFILLLGCWPTCCILSVAAIVWQHAIEVAHSNRPADFIPVGTRSRVLSHSHSGTLDIRPAVRCGRERPPANCHRGHVPAERPFERAQANSTTGKLDRLFAATRDELQTSRQGCSHSTPSNSTDNPDEHRAARIG